MTQRLMDMLRDVELLAPDERMVLIEHLVEKATDVLRHAPTPRNWRDIRGIGGLLPAGEDAQAWITRTHRS